ICQKFNLTKVLQELYTMLNCCGIDYANVNEHFTWCAPLSTHKYASRFHLNKHYRLEDPYHDYHLARLLPKICSFSDLSTYSESWGDLLYPSISSYGECHALSYCFMQDNTVHRFVFYYADIHQAMTFYIRCLDLYPLLMDLMPCLIDIQIKFQKLPRIDARKLKPLKLSPRWYSEKEKFDISKHYPFNAKEVLFFEVLSQGIKEKNEIATRLKISPRTIDGYIHKFKQKLQLDSVHELFEYAKKCQIFGESIAKSEVKKT
ncbi:LuxR C-terminal-related transcriptional regulator, partial [Fangia hongkongensis]|uniref:LuxR C-terminal-related transcriptional regulator n=2 Tax=Fangia hongkongensis TaxID=270495 RepID=UPI001F433E0C